MPDRVLLRTEQFERVAAFVEEAAGIRMPASKREMVQARLGRRLRALGIRDYDEYLAYAFESPDGEAERAHLIDVVTTNQTEFFREADHFDFLTRCALPAMMHVDPSLGVSRPLVAWSAGCSTGEEPYSIAMALADHRLRAGQLSHVVYGTDICTDALQHATEGVYDEQHLDHVPPRMRGRYVHKGGGLGPARARIAPHIRHRVRFARMNLISDRPPFPQLADIVFCRNVLIYFERPTQLRVLARLAEHMRPGGYLFVGHSEMLQGLDLPFTACAPTVHQRV